MKTLEELYSLAHARGQVHEAHVILETLRYARPFGANTEEDLCRAFEALVEHNYKKESK